MQETKSKQVTGRPGTIALREVLEMEFSVISENDDELPILPLGAVDAISCESCCPFCYSLDFQQSYATEWCGERAQVSRGRFHLRPHRSSAHRSGRQVPRLRRPSPVLM